MFLGLITTDQAVIAVPTPNWEIFSGIPVAKVREIY